MATPWKPTAAQLRSAEGKRVADLIAPGLAVLFCGINPGLYSGAVGHHFARPGNRFWPALRDAGFTDGLLSPFAEEQLLARGYGITNFVERATATADALSAEELLAGARTLKRKVRKHRPRVLAVLGVGAYRTGFARRSASLGLQPETIGETAVWVLPNPSGLNAHYGAAELARLFRALRSAVEADPDSPPSDRSVD